MNEFRNIGTEQWPIWIRPDEVISIANMRVPARTGGGWNRLADKTTINLRNGEKIIVEDRGPTDVLRNLFVESAYMALGGRYILDSNGDPPEGVSYPTRARIIDVTGVVKEFGGQEFKLNTPESSKPHIGKEGLADQRPGGSVTITLDDGTVLLGHECWWEPIE